MQPTPSASSLVTSTPRFRFTAQLSGDGRYIFITPTSFLSPGTTYHVRLAGRWGADGVRIANETQPGSWTRYGRFAGSLSFRTAPAGGSPQLSVAPGQVSSFELRRLALPLPSFLTSVNQIGFDSYVLLVGALAIGRPDRAGVGSILLWATQARQGPDGAYLADPRGTLVFPLAGSYRGDTLLLSVHRAVLTFSFGTVPLQRLNVRFQFGRSLQAEPGASLYAEAQCLQIPNYGAEALLTGLCNNEKVLAATGAFLTSAYPTGGQANRRPRGLSVGSVGLQPPTALTSGSVTARLTLSRGVRYPAAEHRVALLLVDGTGQPLGLDYTDQSASTDRAGDISRVVLKLPAGTVMPSRAVVLHASRAVRIRARPMRRAPAPRDHTHLFSSSPRPPSTSVPCPSRA